eukprot:scaffold923_cov171-Amphora_coffeaeformis.AAC.14
MDKRSDATLESTPFAIPNIGSNRNVGSEQFHAENRGVDITILRFDNRLGTCETFFSPKRGIVATTEDKVFIYVADCLL